MTKLAHSKIYPKFTVLGASFYFTFLALAGTTFTTFVGSVSPHSAENPKNRLLMDSLLFDNAVNMTASFMYSYFVQDLHDGLFQLDKVMDIRYLDWSITTPLLIVALVFYFKYFNEQEDKEEEKRPIRWGPVGVAILFNFAMLLFGYLGETGAIGKWTGFFAGFAGFLGMAWPLWTHFARSTNAKKLFAAFAGLWSLYGFAYAIPNEVGKNIAYNVLDLFAKVGLGFLTVVNIMANNREWERTILKRA